MRKTAITLKSRYTGLYPIADANKENAIQSSLAIIFYERHLSQRFGFIAVLQTYLFWAQQFKLNPPMIHRVEVYM